MQEAGGVFALDADQDGVLLNLEAFDGQRARLYRDAGGFAFGQGLAVDYRERSPAAKGNAAQLQTIVAFGNRPGDRGLPVAGFELGGEALRLLNGPGIQLECQFVHLNPAYNGAWCRVGEEAKPGVSGDQIGAGAETLLQGFAHVPASVSVEVGCGHERPADAFRVVRPHAEGLGTPKGTKEEHFADVVFTLDIALDGGFAVPG